ncbi:hypothetical protein WH87_09665 [Devosia epidermidihirudinis]|uniref:DUF2134 domain-containing protein n=2 Tax=Devosia epidermidihirudinis TaxID=1293439 RepID=A0A0F5QAC7_9HYPH|nr:hypothetical protein WH87_09665 [Devosia epidermidihirudinis]
MVVMFAMGFSISAVVGAIAVDSAALYSERRSVQNAVDLAALAAAADPSRASQLADAALREAGLSGTVRVRTGRYTASAALTPQARFVVGGQPANAVEVHLERRGTLHFASGWAESPLISAQALATLTPQVAFSAGSRLANFDGGIANDVLDQLLGARVSVSVADYNGLLAAQVDVFSFLEALSQQLNLKAVTYDDVLAASADHGKIAAALAAVLTGTQQVAARNIARSVGNNGVVPLRRLFQLGQLGAATLTSGGGRGLYSAVSALELLSVSAGLSNGKRQIGLGVAANVPGLLGINVGLSVGEPPQGGSWFAIGPNQTVTRTAQVRLRIISRLTLKLLFLSLLQVNVPLYLDVAPAEAIADSATCPSPSSPRGTVTILAKPGVARLSLGEVNENSFGAFNTTPNIGTAVLINMLGIKVTTLAHAAIEQVTPIRLQFSSADIAAGKVRTAHTSTYTTSLVGSLLGDLKLVAVGISLGVIGPALEALLSPLTPVLDLTIERLLAALGLSLGEVDVKVYGVRCTHPVLVG